MPDERVHPTKGGLERGEPIGRLFRDVEKYLYAVRDSLLLRWEITSSQRVDPTEGVELTNID